MAVSHTGTYVQNPKTTPQSIVPADASTKKTVVTAGANGSKVTALTAASTDTAARIGQVWLTRAAVSYLLHSQTIAITAGNDGTTSPQSMFANWPLPTDNDGQKYLHLESGDTLQVSTTTTVTAAKEIDFCAIWGDF